MLVTDAISKERVREIASAVSDASRSEKTLYFRSISEVEKLINGKNLTVAFKGEELAGFLININYGENWTEITTIYVYPKFRGEGISKEMIHFSVERNRSNLFLYTKNAGLIEYLGKEGFKVSNYSLLSRKLTLEILFDRAKNPRRFIDMLVGLPDEKNIKILTKQNKL